MNNKNEMFLKNGEMFGDENYMEAIQDNNINNTEEYKDYKEYEEQKDNEEHKEYEELKDVEIDDIFFNDFKNKFENELKNDEIQIDEMPEITLEQAVSDYVKEDIDDAFDYLYAHYQPILNRWGKRCNNEELGVELLDIVLFNAVKTFDATAGAKFNTYFWTCAKNYINCYKIKHDAKKRQHNKKMSSLQQKYSYKSDSGDVELEKLIEDKSLQQESKDYELKMSIKSLEGYLKPNEITILLRLIDNDTLQEIGDDLGVTAAAVCMTLKRLSKKKNVAGKLRNILIND